MCGLFLPPVKPGRGTKRKGKTLALVSRDKVPPCQVPLNEKWPRSAWPLIGLVVGRWLEFVFQTSVIVAAVETEWRELAVEVTHTRTCARVLFREGVEQVLGTQND